jgi:hypothetical protein
MPPGAGSGKIGSQLTITVVHLLNIVEDPLLVGVTVKALPELLSAARTRVS